MKLVVSLSCLFVAAIQLADAEDVPDPETERKIPYTCTAKLSDSKATCRNMYGGIIEVSEANIPAGRTLELRTIYEYGTHLWGPDIGIFKINGPGEMKMVKQNGMWRIQGGKGRCRSGAEPSCVERDNCMDTSICSPVSSDDDSVYNH